MKQASGFTMVELIIVTALTALLSGVILQFGLSYMRFGSIAMSDSSAFVERMNAADYLRENVGMSSGIVMQNNIDDNHVLVPDTDPLHWKTLYPVSNVVYGNSSSITPVLYFKKFSKTSTGALIPYGATYYEDEFIMYHDGPAQQLRIRTLANPTAPGNAKQTTCPDASATSSCPADTMLISGITSVKLRYFSRAGNELSIVSHGVDALGNGVSPCYTATYPYTGCDGANFGIVEVLEVTLNLQKQPLGTHGVTTKSATIIRVALRNT